MSRSVPHHPTPGAPPPPGARPKPGPRTIPRPGPDFATSAEALRILQVARARFFAHGFHTITMDDLARELGMSKKTLYRHFPHKESLLECILENLADSVATLFEPPTRGPLPSVPDRIRSLIAGIGERLAAIQPAFLESLKRFAPVQFERLEQLRRRNLERHLIPLLEAGQQRGEIRRDLDPAFAVEILLRMIHGLLDPEVLHRFQRTPAQAVAGAVDLFLCGLLPSTPPARIRP